MLCTITTSLEVAEAISHPTSAPWIFRYIIVPYVGSRQHAPHASRPWLFMQACQARDPPPRLLESAHEPPRKLPKADLVRNSKSHAQAAAPAAGGAPTIAADGTEVAVPADGAHSELKPGQASHDTPMGSEKDDYDEDESE